MSLSDTTQEAADRLIARYPHPRSALLPLLYLVQAEHGRITPEGLAFCAAKLDLTKAEVQAVQTFYEMFERDDVGDWLVTVCTNFACKVRGAAEVYDRLVEEIGGRYDRGHGVAVKHLECLGNCEDAPVVQVNYQNYHRVDVGRALELLAACRRGAPPPAANGETPPTFREVCWRLAGATDDMVVHAGAVHGAQADIASYEEPPAERIFGAEHPVGGPGITPPGPDRGETAVTHVDEVSDHPPHAEPPAGGRLNEPAAPPVSVGQASPPAREPDEEQLPTSEEEPIEERSAPTPEPPEPPQDRQGPYPGPSEGQWGRR